MIKHDQKIRVLVIDDDKSIRDMFQRVLKEDKYEVIEAEHGSQGLELLKVQNIDICFLDIRMPKMEGLAALKEIKRIYNDMIVVMITAFGNSQEGLKALNLGASDYIYKPFDIKKIKDLINFHLKGKFKPSIVLKGFNAERAELERQDAVLIKAFNILIVDDEAELRILLQRVMGHQGHQVVTAVDGGEAVNLLRKTPFNLVITDLKMPVLSGIDVLKAAKKINPDTEVIILTGFGSLETAQEAVRMGAYDYLTKPLDDINYLVRIARRALEKHRLTQENQLLTENLKRHLFEIDTLYEISNAISYTLEYDYLVTIIMSSLRKIIDYDIACSFLMETGFYNLNISLTREVDDKLIDRVKKNVLGAFAALKDQVVLENKINLSIDRIYAYADDEEKAGNHGKKGPDGSKADVVADIQSFFNVPIMIGDNVLGMINITSHRENAFSENDVKLFYTIANQMAGAIERLKSIIAQEKTKMESMVASMDEGVIMIDEAREIVVLNPKAREMLGFEAKEEVSSQLLHASFKSIGLDIPVNQCLNTNQMVSKEISMNQGKEKFLQCQIVPVENADKRIIGIVTVLIDLTQRKQAEERLRDQKKALEQINKELDAFAFTISHDLRAPLRSIIGFCNFLKKDNKEKLSKESLEDIDSIINNGQKMSEMMEAILEFSRIGKAEKPKERVNIKSVIDETILLMDSDIKEKNAVTLLEGDFPEMLCYKERVTQIFLNLIGNSLKYIEAGQTPKIRIGCVKKDGLTWFYVKDNGIGIKKDFHSRIFNIFSRLHNENSPYKGSGIGLSNVKKIIEIHGGEIYVESHEGEGSAFYFTLRSADIMKLGEILVEDKVITEEQLNGALAKQETKHPPTIFTRRILVVDDDRDSIRLFKRSIEGFHEDFVVSYVTSGKEAIDYVYGKDKFADRAAFPMCGVILLDINMPGITGFDVLEKIREDSRFKELPIITMYTSSNSPEDKNKALKSGANDYINKNEDFDKVFSKVKELMGQIG